MKTWRVAVLGCFAVACAASDHGAPPASSADARAADPRAVQASAPVLTEDFESGRGSAYLALVRDPLLALAEGEGVGGGRALKASYVGGEMGSRRIVRRLSLGVQGTDFTLNYDVKFDDGFQFVRGGKLHGLGPRRPVTGGDAIRPDGWSARVMWREGGVAEAYIYHQDQRGKYGEAGTVIRPFAFEPGRYHAVSLHVKLNDPADRANGIVRLFVDGVLIEEREGLRLRSIDGEASLISQFLFSTFHGGNDPSWAPRDRNGDYANVRAWFDNFAVYAGERIRPAPGM